MRTIISVDPNGKPVAQPHMHTRWHPDIPPVATVNVGEAFKVECMDFSGNSISNDDCADDVLDYCWDQDHHLSGPIRIEGAQAGDLLHVEIMDVQPFPNRPWGFSMIEPGAGPLDKNHTRVAKAIWDFEGAITSSRHIKGVSFQGRPHCGEIGTAPSAALLESWTEREKALNHRFRSHGAVCANEPSKRGAYVGQELPSDLAQKIRLHGARTTPARENGGNIDSGTLTSGASIYLPIYVDGANLSVGDLHFSIGDGEPTCAIEMAGIMTMKCHIIAAGMDTLGFTAPVVIPSVVDHFYQARLAFHGLSVSDQGMQHLSNPMTGYIQAASAAMKYLQRFGYSHEQAYILMACAPIECRLLATPNIPTANVSVALPLSIFNADLRPSSTNPVVHDYGSVAYLSEEREKLHNTRHPGPPSPFCLEA